jgi:DNA-binding Lrp family transcriptional regulator
MNVESRRDLQMLEALEAESQITQRTLASRLGIALGLTNLYLKRLIRKGYIKCVTVAPNRLVYLVTPRGVARRTRLTYEFMKYSLDYYRHVRRHLRRSLAALVTGDQAIAIYGTGEAAELVFLIVKEMGLNLVAVFGSADDSMFLGLPVQSLRQHEVVRYDVVIMAVFERPAATRRRLIAAGIPPDKILMLHLPGTPAARDGDASAALVPPQ